MKFHLICWTIWIALSLTPAASELALAQTSAPTRAKGPVAQTGIVQGTVKDDTGGIVPGAEVTLANATGATRTATAGDDGAYSFGSVVPASYTLTATYSGLRTRRPAVITVTTGHTISADIVLTIESQKQEITVTEAVSNQVSTEASNNASALILKQEDLDALPDDPDDLEADLEALAGPSAGPGGTQIFIDGFTGGRLPPKSSIREIRINSNPFSAEYDRLGFGRIEIFTKPGTDRFHGQGYFGVSDGIWNSRNPFLAEAPPFRMESLGGNLSGRLTKSSSFFLDVDRRNIDDNGIVNAIIPAASLLGSQAFQGFEATPQRRTTVSPRVDYQLTPSNTLSMRYAFLDNEQLLAGIGGFNVPALTIGSLTLPSAAYQQTSGEQLFQFVDTAVLSPSALNEARFQFARDTTHQTSESTLPSLNVLSSFTAGGSGYSAAGYPRSYDTQNQLEASNQTSITAGAHVVKFGVRVRANVIDDYAPRNFNGTYTFQGTSSLASINQYLSTIQLLSEGYSSQQVTAMGYGPSYYTVSSGKPYIGISQVDAGPFVQDDWRMKPNLTVSLGLRWEAQTNIHDARDFAPRVAFAWSPDARSSGGGAKTVVRGGFGIFYDRFQAFNVLNAYRYNGTNQVNYVLANPTSYDIGFDTTLPISALALSSQTQRYQIDHALESPRVMQMVLGVERQLFKRTTLQTNFIQSRGLHELRTVDINAPLPGTYILGAGATGVRPYGNVGDIYDYQSSGMFKQTQVSVGVNTTIGRWVTLFSRYAYGDAHSDTDGLQTMPSNPYNWSQDWSRSSLDIRNMLFFGGSVSAPWGLRLSPFFVAHSGAPFNITTGTDVYGTGPLGAFARPSIASAPGTDVVDTPFGYLDTLPLAGQTILARNAGQSPGFLELNLRLSKTWSFGTTKFEGMSGGSTSRQGGGPPGGGPPPGGRGGPGGPGGGGPPPGGGGPPPGMGSEASEHRYSLTLSLMARNVLNHENLNAPVGVLTSPYFLQSTGITGGFGPEAVASNQRRLDLQLRFSF